MPKNVSKCFILKVSVNLRLSSENLAFAVAQNDNVDDVISNERLRHRLEKDV